MEELTEGGYDVLPRWLPGGEGKTILFMRDRYELHVLEIGTGRTVRVLEQANVDYVVVGGDGPG